MGSGVRFSVLAAVVLAVVLSTTPVSAQTFGGNLGSLGYNESRYGGTCTTSSGDRGMYVEFVLDDFVYTPPVGSSQPFNNTAYYVESSPGTGTCPPVGTVPTGFGGSGYTIEVVPSSNGASNATISVPGYINPKYVVLGVTYAPPGPGSSIDYTESTLISNSSSISHTFTNANAVTVTVTYGGSILGFAKGSVSDSESAQWSEANNTSSSVTISKTTSVGTTVDGPCCAFLGVDHDYDVIWLWLNPVDTFTMSGSSGSYGVAWTGYGYSTLDTNGMDVVGVYVGYLNGDFGSLPSSLQTSFARAWAGGESWGSGNVPGLTSSDLANVLAADPYGECTYESPIGSANCPTPDANRFTVTGNEDALYEQAPPGGQPFKETFSYATTNSQSQSVQQTQSFGLESVFSAGGSIFGSSFSYTIKTSNTLTWTNVTNQQVAQSNSSTATLSIVGPPCSGNPCSPVYPPNQAYSLGANAPSCSQNNCAALNAPQAYGQAWEFQIYQDNVYGGFLLVPDSNAYAIKPVKCPTQVAKAATTKSERRLPSEAEPKR